MTPAQATASYRRAIDAVGEDIQIRRYTGATTYVEKTVKARVTGFDPVFLQSGVSQGRRRLIVMAEDVGDPITLPITKDDKVVVDGVELSIEAPDASTRRIAGVTVAFEIVALG